MGIKICSSFEFPVSLVKLYLYCPRIPYFVLFMGAKERTTELMRAGREEHEKRVKSWKKRGWNTGVLLHSKKYGIYGRVDAFWKEENGYVVYEFKYSEYDKRSFKMHVYQAAAYALLVEENFGRVIRLVLEYRDRKVEVPFSRGIRNYVVSIINKIHKMDSLTYRVDRRKCGDCGYRHLCNDLTL